MKRITALFIVVVMALGLTACGETVGDITLGTSESAIYIQKDGSVSYAVSEKFDKDYYDEDKLKDEIDKEVDSYNNGSSASVNDAISIKNYKVKDKEATLVLDFATSYDFLSYSKNYNNFPTDKFYVGLITDNSDCKVKGDFVSPDKKKTVKGKEIKKMTDAYILIVNEQYKVQLDGTVHYISTNCSIDDDGIITTAKADKGLSYIVYNID